MLCCPCRTVSLLLGIKIFILEYKTKPAKAQIQALEGANQVLRYWMDNRGVDHIIPKAEGGKDQYSNYQLLHRHCHHQKTAEDRQRQIEHKENKSHNNDRKKVVYRK